MYSCYLHVCIHKCTLCVHLLITCWSHAFHRLSEGHTSQRRRSYRCLFAEAISSWAPRANHTLHSVWRCSLRSTRCVTLLSLSTLLSTSLPILLSPPLSPILSLPSYPLCRLIPYPLSPLLSPSPPLSPLPSPLLSSLLSLNYIYYLVSENNQEEGIEKVLKILQILPSFNYNLLKYTW